MSKPRSWLDLDLPSKDQEQNSLDGSQKWQYTICNSPRRVVLVPQSEHGSLHDDFRPATWPPPLSPRDDMEETPNVLGFHRLSHLDRDDQGSDEDHETSTSDKTYQIPEHPLANQFVANRIPRNRTSTMFEYIGTRMQELYTDIKTPRQDNSDLRSGYDDPEHVPQQEFFLRDNHQTVNNIPFKCDAQIVGSRCITARTSSPKNIVEPRKEEDHNNPTILQRAFISGPLSGHPPFSPRHTHREQRPDVQQKPDVEPEQPREAASPEQMDQNAVAEWWSNLFKFQPGAPSQQARLIRSTHEKLVGVLIKKDERIESLHAQTIALERTSKAAEIFSHTIIAELEASRSALSCFGENEIQYLTSFRQQTAEMQSEMQRRLQEAHVKELSELTAKLLEEARLKEKALEKIGLLEKQEERLTEMNQKKSESVQKAMSEMEKMQAELEKMQAALCGKELETQKMQANIDQKDLLFLSLSDTVNEIGTALQQKEAELKLQASEHNAAMKQNDEKMLYELELLSKAKSAEMDEVLATNRRKEQEYESLIYKMDARLKALEEKHTAELSTLSGGMLEKVDIMRSALRAKEFEIEGLQQKLSDKEEIIRDLTSSLDDERHCRKLGESSFSDLAKSMEEKNHMLEKRLQMREREHQAEIARLNSEIERLKTLLNQQRAPKLVGIGMRITDEPPHRVTEIIAGGAAHQSGEIAVGDYILEVGHMDVSHHPIELIRKNILGPAGSYLDLKLDRRDENEESRVFSVTIKRSEIIRTDSAPMAEEQRKLQEGARVWHVLGSSPTPSAAGSSPEVIGTPNSTTNRPTSGTLPPTGVGVVPKKKKASGFGILGPSAPGPMF